jgi:hypothetical protein
LESWTEFGSIISFEELGAALLEKSGFDIISTVQLHLANSSSVPLIIILGI